MTRSYAALMLVAAVALAGLPHASHAAQLDPVTITGVTAGHAKLEITLQAGPSGAPDGFTIWWAKTSDYNLYGGYWPATPAAWMGWASFTGAPTLNTEGGSITTFVLGPDQTIMVEIGDLFDETGVAGTTDTELTYDESWSFCAFANGGATGTQSVLSTTLADFTTSSTNCTYTQGYWKNHTGAWPVSNLTLGSVNYDQTQLLSILNQPAVGNGLISLAHQLIAAKLNIANGASSSTIDATISAADALIGALVVPPVGSGYLDPSTTSALTQALDDYNNGITGPGSCEATPTAPSTWGRVKTLYR